MEFDEAPPKVLHHGAHEPGSLILAGVRSLDMDNLALGRQAATLTTATSGTLRLDFGAGRWVEVQGDFTIAGGAPTGGTVARVQVFEAGQLAMDITNTPFNPAALVRDLLARDFDGVVHSLFGGADEVRGSALADSLTGYNGDDTLMGGDGNDFIRGLNDADIVEGGAGDDDLNGNLGIDVVRGGGGADTVRGGQDNDYVFGDAGDDPHLNGNLGDDEVFGGAGRDTLFGGQGNDMLFGDEGDDLLSGDLGADTLTGGAGADRFLLRAGGGFDWIADFSSASGDRVQIAPGVAYTVVTVSGQAVIDLGGGDRIGLAGVAVADLGTWLAVG